MEMKIRRNFLDSAFTISFPALKRETYFELQVGKKFRSEQGRLFNWLEQERDSFVLLLGFLFKEGTQGRSREKEGGFVRLIKIDLVQTKRRSNSQTG